MAAPLKQFSDSTSRELQAMLRWWRAQPRETFEASQSDYPPGPYYSRMFRTQGDNPNNLADTTYPTQADGQGFKLPGVFMRVDTATKTWSVIDDGRTHQIYSPGGWIPRLTILRVSYRSGAWVPDFVPLIPCRFDAAVTAPTSTTVEIRESGAQNTQTFTAHFDWMAGTNSSAIDDEALAWLNEQTQQWELINKAC